MSEIGYGVELWVGATDAATTATVQLALLSQITPPTLSRDEVEATTLDSPDYLRQFIPSMIDPGELAIEGNYVPDNATEILLLSLFGERKPRYYEIRFTQYTPEVVYKGYAFIKNFERGVPMEDKMTFTATLRATTQFEVV